MKDLFEEAEVSDNSKDQFQAAPTLQEQPLLCILCIFCFLCLPPYFNGSRTVNVVPFPGLLLNSIFPSRFSTIMRVR